MSDGISRRDKKRAKFLANQSAQALNTDAQAKRETVISAPGQFATTVSDDENSMIDSQLQFSYLKDNLSKLGMSLTDFLALEGVNLSKPERTVKTPFGEYQVATTHLSYEQLTELCVIDPDNVRDASERTEEALSDIIDEIGAGLQTTPIVAYIDDNGKTSIAEGSRRHDSAIIRKVGLDVEYYSPKPTQEVIRWLVETSDKKSKFSYFDKGKLFLNLMETHNWSQSDLSRERKYLTQEISRCVNFVTAPPQLLEYLETKRIAQSTVDKFTSALSTIKKNDSLNDVLEYMSSIDLSVHSTAKKRSEEAVKHIYLAAKGQTAPSKKEPTHTFGQSKLFVSRSKSGVNLNIKQIPTDKEEEILAAIEKILAQKLS